MKRRSFLKVGTASFLFFGLPGSVFAEIPEETKEEKDERMAWWRSARFGMFIHWGIYSVPQGRYKGKEIKGPGEWIMHNARIPIAEYEGYAKQFNPLKFNAGEWVEIAKGAGMKYMVITSKHHDGFCMFDSKLTNYDIVDATPFKRDVIKELSLACQKEGIKFGLYYSILDWHHPDQKKNFPKYLEYMKGQLKELLKNYGEISVLFYDGDWILEWTKKKGEDLERYTRQLAPKIIINNRVGKRPLFSMLSGASLSKKTNPPGDYDTPEQVIPKGMQSRDWETCMTMNDSWGYKIDDNNWKSSKELIRTLIDIVSKGGNFLLNVGPNSEGLIPQPSVERLREMGKWLTINGESIYGTEPGPVQNLEFVRSTRKLNKIFLHIFDFPKDELEVSGITENVKRAYVISDKSKPTLDFIQSKDKILIKIPVQYRNPIATLVVMES